MAQLNYKHLRYFQAVAQDGNLTRAADSLNLSQSALSVQIKTLEAQLGHALFERRGRSLLLTEAGRIALDHAEAIFQAGDELLDTLSGGGSARPTLRIGALSTLSKNFQIGLLRPVLARPDAKLILRSGTEESLLDELEALALDAVLLNQAVPDPKRAESLRAHRLAEQEASLVVTPARLETAPDRLEDFLAEVPLILPGRQSSVRLGFDALVQRLEVTPNIVAEADDMAVLRLLAREDIGAAILPPVVIQDELAMGRLVEAHPLPGVTETFFALTPARRFPNPLLPLIFPTL